MYDMTWHACRLSRVCLFATPWTAACQAPPSLEFSRQEYWRGWPFPTPRELPHPGFKHMSGVSCAARQILFHCATWEAPIFNVDEINSK